MKHSTLSSSPNSSNTLVACCPVRVQRKRVKGWKMPENTLSCFEYLWREEKDIKRMGIQDWLPATEQEYNDYINSLK